MLKVDQTTVDKGNGNCMQAAIASLFEKPLDEVINPIELPETAWFVPFIEWLEANTRFTYSATVNAHDEKEQTKKALRSIYAVNGLFYGVVPSKNFEGVTHAVIINRFGVVVHDPNPDRKWLSIDVVETGDLKYWFLFEPKAEELSAVYEY